MPLAVVALLVPVERVATAARQAFRRLCLPLGAAAVAESRHPVRLLSEMLVVLVAVLHIGT